MGRTRQDAGGTPPPGGGPDLDPGWVGRVREALAAWYDRDHRARLPWREERDAYRVLVSEVMLVQTTTAAVAPFYERFLARFPGVADLAAAGEADVLKAWEGLGYYRRARQLHAAARAIVAEHGGRVPDDPEALRRLPGVGPYIAGAVLSFAFDRPAPIVEANTQRVLARLVAWDGPLGSAATTRRLWDAAGRLVPPDRPGRFNQALMDLGALICTPASPRCLVCPLADLCRARREGVQDAIPVKAARPEVSRVGELAVLAERGGRWLMLRRAPGRLWEGFWEFPTLHVSGADPAGRGTPAGAERSGALRELTGLDLRIDPGPPVLELTYGVTRYRVSLAVHRATGADPGGEGDPRPGAGFDAASWLSPSQIGSLPRSAATRRIARHVFNAGEARASGPGALGPDDANV